MSFSLRLQATNYTWMNLHMIKTLAKESICVKVNTVIVTGFIGYCMLTIHIRITEILTTQIEVLLHKF